MSVKTGNSIKVMVSMTPAIHAQLVMMSNILGSSKSKIVAQALILMAVNMKEAGYAVDKDVYRKVFEG